MNDFYVYVYWRLDINEIFYVGKGRGDRWRRLNKRNEHFKRIINKCDVACEILFKDLSEVKAHELECFLINELVFNYGYSIDILNNRSKEHGRHLGKKHSVQTKLKISNSLKGEKNPCYGKHHTDELKQKSMIDKGDKIIAINIENGNMLFFNSIRDAHRNGFNRSCISQCLNPNGNQSTHKGYKWYRLILFEL